MSAEHSERALAAMILADPGILDELTISTADFEPGPCRNVYQAVLRLREDDLPVTAVSVLETSHGSVPASLLSALLDEYVTSRSRAYHEAEVRTHARLRRLRTAARQVLADTPGSPMREHVASCEATLEAALSATDLVSDGVALGRLLTGIVEAIERGERPAAGLPTGLALLDEMTGGWHPGELVVIGGRTSQGKSALALGMALRAGVPCLYVSLEMSRDELAARALAMLAHADLQGLRQSSAENLERLRDAALSPPALDIVDPGSMTIDEIASRARRATARGTKLLVVDYAQLVSAEGDSRELQVSAVSRGLKAIAKTCKVPVIALAQLNRQNERRASPEPRLSDFRESGAIENDADVVLLVHRPAYYDANDRPGQAEIILAKQRNGPTGVIRCAFLERCADFRALTEDTR